MLVLKLFLIARLLGFSRPLRNGPLLVAPEFSPNAKFFSATFLKKEIPLVFVS